MPKKAKAGKRGRGRKKKKEPRCPVKRRKKAIKKKCTDVMDPAAILNSYYVCHGVQDMLKFRKFTWKKKKKVSEMQKFKWEEYNEWGASNK